MAAPAAVRRERHARWQPVFWPAAGVQNKQRAYLSGLVAMRPALLSACRGRLLFSGLADNESLMMAGAVAVVPARGADAAPRRVRHRDEVSKPARVQEP